MEGQIIFRTVDGSHAFPADMSAGPEPTARRRRRYEASAKQARPRFAVQIYQDFARRGIQSSTGILLRNVAGLLVC